MSNIQQKAQATYTQYVDPYVPTVAKNAAGFAYTQAQNALNFSSQQAQNAMEFGKVIVTGATTTLTAYTPGPVLNLVNSTIAAGSQLREDPVNTVKGYVPTFVIHAGEKTYEIVQHTADSTKKNVEATSGFIVTRANGVIESVSNVPVIHSVIEKLQKMTANKEAPVAPVAAAAESESITAQ